MQIIALLLSTEITYVRMFLKNLNYYKLYVAQQQKERYHSPLQSSEVMYTVLN